MAAQDQAQFQADGVLFGPDDGSSVNLFLDDSVAATVNDSPNGPGGPASLSYSNLLQDTPPYESYDLSTALASLFDQRPPWPMPPQTEAAPLNNPVLPKQAVSPTSLYAESMNDQAQSHIQNPPRQNAFPRPPCGNFTFSSAITNPTDGLTAAQQERLKSIAMPAHLQYHSPKSDGASPISPVDLDRPDGASNDDPLTIASKTSSRKRKSTDDLDDDDDDDDDVDTAQPVKKTAHNMIEKRYRTNLNDKIAALRDSVPSLRIMSKSARGEDTTLDREELHGLTPAHKLNKATVLSKATEYIRHLEKRNNRLLDENSAMQARITAFEKLFMAGAMNGAISPMQQPPTPIQYSTDPASYMSPQLGTTRGPDPPGMIQVPEDMKRIISAQMAVGQPYPIGQQQQPFQNPAMSFRQQQIQQQQQIQRQRWSNAPPGYYGKLMVGSLAGLMILEAFREKEVSNEKTEGRGLSALPVPLFNIFFSSTSFDVAGYHVSGTHLLLSFKLLLLGCALYWAFLSHFFQEKKTKGEKVQQSTISLEAVPPLASPIHVRRQAWLTAIQTVWVPECSWWLEAVALILKILKASLRTLIGTQSYQALTGVTEEQEAARVKAWGIALDAQLTGGDNEINKARLSLTYLASRTLPDTPLRLMQKALHFRLLMWELRNTRFTFGILNILAMEKARAMWNEARQLNVTLRQLRRSSSNIQDNEELPSHLEILLEQDCSDVLNDGILQRAYNLAWNFPTGQNAIGPTDGMDTVVDDHAIRSPLDAIAAWYSSLLLQQTLSASLNMDRSDTDGNRELKAKISLAIKTAPVGSIAQSRALIARAVVFDERRGVNVANALQVIGSLNPDKAAKKLNPPLLDTPLSIVSTPDARMALRCAMAMAILNKHSVDHPSFQIVEEVTIDSQSSLLGWTAAYKLMKRLHGHPSAARDTYAEVLERLSGSLRIWMGSSAGDGCALDSKTRNKSVERCLAITKSVVGMEVDTGYGSLSDTDELETLLG